MIAEQIKHTHYLEDEYEQEMLRNNTDFVAEGDEDLDPEYLSYSRSRWTFRRLVIMLIVVVIAAAVVVFVLLPLVDGWINPANPLNLPTPIRA